MKSLRNSSCVCPIILALALGPGTHAALRADPFIPVAQDRIVPAGAGVELLWAMGEFTEGPAAAPDGAVLFSDIGNTIYRFDPGVTEAESAVTVYRANSGRANGLMFGPDGRLVACEGAAGGTRRISVTDPGGKVRTLADRWQGRRFNSPNDLAIDSRGNTYFTDPRYGGDEPREIEFEGVFLVRPDGEVSLATRDVGKPNGIVISPDGSRVYIADRDTTAHGSRRLLVFSVNPDGTLADKKTLHNFGDSRGIDGMTIDAKGNVFATAGSEHLRFQPGRRASRLHQNAWRSDQLRFRNRRPRLHSLHHRAGSTRREPHRQQREGAPPLRTLPDRSARHTQDKMKQPAPPVLGRLQKFPKLAMAPPAAHAMVSAS